MRGQQVGRGGAPGRAHQQTGGGAGDDGLLPGGDWGPRTALPLQAGQPRHRAEIQF